MNRFENRQKKERSEIEITEEIERIQMVIDDIKRRIINQKGLTAEEIKRMKEEIKIYEGRIKNLEDEIKTWRRKEIDKKIKLKEDKR